MAAVLDGARLIRLGTYSQAASKQNGFLLKGTALRFLLVADACPDFDAKRYFFQAFGAASAQTIHHQVHQSGET